MRKCFTETSATDTDKIIIAVLRALGLSQAYKGFNYLVFAINLILEEPERLSYICKDLYLEIAFSYNTSVSSAERNIRTAKQVIWHNGDADLLKGLFGDLYALGTPSNAIFIESLANYIRQLIK